MKLNKIEESIKKRKIGWIIYHLSKNCLEHNIGKNAASLAYYLMFAIFPILIIVSNLFGILNININTIIHVLGSFLPLDMVELLGEYMNYVSHSSNRIILGFVIVFSIWFPMRAAKELMNDVRLAYHLDKPENMLSYTIHQLMYTVVLLIVIGLTLFLSIMGREVVTYINYLLPEKTIRVSGFLLGLWQYLRFIPVGLLMFAALGTLYALSMDEKPTLKEIKPGIITALISWMILSVGFSFYVENIAHYSIIYGAMGAVIVLLIWLYMTAVILIIGAELNAVLQNNRG